MILWCAGSASVEMLEALWSPRLDVQGIKFAELNHGPCLAAKKQTVAGKEKSSWARPGAHGRRRKRAKRLALQAQARGGSQAIRRGLWCAGRAVRYWTR